MSRIRNEYTMESLRHAQWRRQAILDHLRAHPWASFEAVLTALQRQHPQLDNVNAISMRGAIANMLKKREIAASGHPRQRSYMALVEFTESAEDMRNAQLHRQKRNNFKNYGKQAEQTKLARERKRQQADRPRPTKHPKPTSGTAAASSTSAAACRPDRTSAARAQCASQSPSTVFSFFEGHHYDLNYPTRLHRNLPALAPGHRRQ